MNNELELCGRALLTSSELALSRELDLTAQNAGTILSDQLVAEWFREFSGQPSERLTEAFRWWRRRSKFFPKINEIWELIEGSPGTDVEIAYVDKCDQEFRSLQTAIEKGRRQGEVKGFAEWIATNPELAKDLDAIKRKMSLPRPGRKVLKFPERSAIHGVVMTAEQIAARRAKELDEIRTLNAEGK